MTASPKQLAANRENARKSTGPRSDAGKDRSRLNGLTHGMRSEAILLPGEDPEVLDARREAWLREWQPEGEVELGYLETALIASWRVDRCLRHETATLTKQILDARDDLDETEQEDVARLATRLFEGVDPTGVFYQLRRTVTGCGWLLGRWKLLKALLDARKYWDTTEREHALNLIGKSSTDMFRDQEVSRVEAMGLALILGPKPAPEKVREHVFEPDTMPREEYHRRLVGMASLIPTPEQATAFLNQLIQEQIEELTELMELLEARAERDRAAAADRLCFDESKAGAARQRYEMAHRRVLRQALDDLRKAQERRRAAPAPTEAKSEPPEANPNPPAPSEAKPDRGEPAPSEPNSESPEANSPVLTVREGLFSRVFTRSAATS
jgi:hypothetical protein